MQNIGKSVRDNRTFIKNHLSLNTVEESSYVTDPVQEIPLDHIRKIADEVAVIPGRCITLMDIIGQGIGFCANNYTRVMNSM